MPLQDAIKNARETDGKPFNVHGDFLKTPLRGPLQESYQPWAHPVAPDETDPSEAAARGTQARGPHDGVVHEIITPQHCDVGEVSATAWLHQELAAVLDAGVVAIALVVQLQVPARLDHALTSIWLVDSRFKKPNKHQKTIQEQVLRSLCKATLRFCSSTRVAILKLTASMAQQFLQAKAPPSFGFERCLRLKNRFRYGARGPGVVLETYQRFFLNITRPPRPAPALIVHQHHLGRVLPGL